MERYQLEDLGVDGRIILRWLQEMGWEDMDWIYLAQDRKRWRTLVNAVMNLRVLIKCRRGGSLISWSTIRFSRRTLLQQKNAAFVENGTATHGTTNLRTVTQLFVANDTERPIKVRNGEKMWRGRQEATWNWDVQPIGQADLNHTERRKCWRRKRLKKWHQGGEGDKKKRI